MKKYFLVSLIVAFAGVGLVISPPQASAADLSKFDPERIIDDGVFTNTSSMSADQIQSFLNKRNAVCLKNLTVPGLRDDNGDGVVQDTTTEAYGPETMTAAQVIKAAADIYGLNPQVLLVTLQKEQGLITGSNCSNIDTALGYGCPDTADCDNAAKGFTRQIDYGAYHLRGYFDDTLNSVPYGVGQHMVYYNPGPWDQANNRWFGRFGDRRDIEYCGGTVLNIRNRATASLYSYTPYQPNTASLAAGYGSAEPCGAYGNRNFFHFFTDWFGTTYNINFVKLDTPRWMQIKNDGTYKTDLISGEAAGGALSAGQQVKFIDKIFLNGKWYLRTEFNYNDKGAYAIAQEALEEIPFEPITPKWITLITDGNRSYPSSRTAVIGDNIIRGTSVKVVDQITVDGNVYYRTEFNRANNQSIGLHSRFVIDFSPIDLAGPRDFCAISVKKLNPLTGQSSDESSGGTFMINKKTLINGVWYFQAETDNGTPSFFNSKDLQNSCYEAFLGPRSMRLNKDTIRFNPFTNAPYDTLPKDMIISLSTKLFMNNQWYYRTSNNTVNDIDAVIPASSFSEL